MIGLWGVGFIRFTLIPQHLTSLIKDLYEQSIVRSPKHFKGGFFGVQVGLIGFRVKGLGVRGRTFDLNPILFSGHSRAVIQISMVVVPFFGFPV